MVCKAFRGEIMADGLDGVTSNLLCSENSSTCFDDLECNAANECDISVSNNGYESFTGFSLLSEEALRVMVEKERDHLPAEDYLKRLLSGELDLSIRREALNWIWKAHCNWGFGPLSFCLSMNYLDRFLSTYELPRGKAWTVQLLAVACLSLAVKLEETKVPQIVKLQVGDPKFVFEGKTIQRMELLVLNTLTWRMQALTPCSFIEYFLCKINDGQYPSGTSLSRSVKLIVSIIKGTDFLEFRPSEIAASVAICVSGEKHMLDSDKFTSYFSIIEKGRLVKCLEWIRDMSLIPGCANVPHSPAGVLDGACLSYRSNNELTVGSCANYSHNSADTRE